MWAKLFVVVMICGGLSAAVHANDEEKLAGGRCTGVADMCAWVGAQGQYACERQRGCNWDEQTNSCFGIPQSCSWQTTPFSCNQISGCRWEPR